MIVIVINAGLRYLINEKFSIPIIINSLGPIIAAAKDMPPPSNAAESALLVEAIFENATVTAVEEVSPPKSAVRKIPNRLPSSFTLKY